MEWREAGWRGKFSIGDNDFSVAVILVFVRGIHQTFTVEALIIKNQSEFTNTEICETGY